MYYMNTFIGFFLKKDIQRIRDKCITCRKTKSKILMYSLYTPSPVPKEPLIYIFMDFVLDLPRLKRARDLIFMVVA